MNVASLIAKSEQLCETIISDPKYCKKEISELGNELKQNILLVSNIVSDTAISASDRSFDLLCKEASHHLVENAIRTQMAENVLEFFSDRVGRRGIAQFLRNSCEKLSLQFFEEDSVLLVSGTNFVLEVQIHEAKASLVNLSLVDGSASEFWKGCSANILKMISEKDFQAFYNVLEIIASADSHSNGFSLIEESCSTTGAVESFFPILCFQIYEKTLFYNPINNFTKFFDIFVRPEAFQSARLGIPFKHDHFFVCRLLDSKITDIETVVNSIRRELTFMEIVSSCTVQDVEIDDYTFKVIDSDLRLEIFVQMDSILTAKAFKGDQTLKLANLEKNKLPKGYLIRPLQDTDYEKGFLECLGHLTTVGDLSQKEFLQRFHFMNQRNDHYFTIVIEDVENRRIAAAGTVAMEFKFIHSNGKIGHIEDIVVNPLYRGKQFGKYIILQLVDIGRLQKCYKIVLDCSEKNVVFYEKCGFVRKEVQMVQYITQSKL